MCDQIVALISSEHSQSIIWNECEDDDSDSEDDDDEGGRIIKCVGGRTTEQEESIQVREGFKVCAPNSPPTNLRGSSPRFTLTTFPFPNLP